MQTTVDKFTEPVFLLPVRQAMKSIWRSIRRWFLDHRGQVTDLVVLLLFSIASGVVLSEADVTRLGLRLTTPNEMLLARWLVWMMVLVLGLLVYAARRWIELDTVFTQADTDVLTGVNNRRKTERLLAHEFDRAMRYGRPLSVIMIDIDHFKRVNDTHGHAVGDIVLTTLARRVRRRMRVSDHFGRWGGEEFLLVCPETGAREAVLVADRMRRTIKHRTMDKAGHVTASFGVSSYTGQADYDALVDEADAFLYTAKRMGRDRVASTLTEQERAQRQASGVPLADEAPGGTKLGSQLASMDFTIAAPPRRTRRGS